MVDESTPGELGKVCHCETRSDSTLPNHSADSRTRVSRFENEESLEPASEINRATTIAHRNRNAPIVDESWNCNPTMTLRIHTLVGVITLVLERKRKRTVTNEAVQLNEGKNRLDGTYSQTGKMRYCIPK